ncbi:hypothetical protein AB0E67_36065, partial [Streptomyces sp. NPDC032161]
GNVPLRGTFPKTSATPGNRPDRVDETDRGTPQGHWAHPAGAAAALLIEQSRPYTAAEAARFWATHRRLRTAMPHYRDALATIAERARPLKDLDGWTLHRLRHSALTHDAEGCTSTPMLPACSRHAPVRSLEWYARPGVDAVARHVAERDPAARRRG